MAANSSAQNHSVIVCEAQDSNLDSLTTIVPRAFHPVNAYIKQALPDTPGMRSWWRSLFASEIENPQSHVLIARDTSQTHGPQEIIALLLLCHHSPAERGVGIWTSNSPIQDMDREKYDAMIASMVEYREKLMLGREHWMVALFGTDQAWQGKAVGTKLLQRACEIADQSGRETFVQANGNARPFYERFGFVCQAQLDMPGEAKYTETFLIRQPRMKDR